MRLDRITGDVLEAPRSSTILFATSARYRLTGIGEIMDREYGIRRGLDSYGFNLCPDCIYTAPCLVLVATNQNEIPSLQAITTAFERCRIVCEHEGIKEIAMPPLFTKEYRWQQIEKIIKDVFASVDINFTVYFRSKERK